MSPNRVPLIQVIAEPDRFNDASLIIAGYLTANNSKTDLIQGFIHLDREDALRHLGNYIPLSFIIDGPKGSEKSYLKFSDAHEHTNRYVMLRGTFSTAAIPAGLMSQITQIDDLSERLDE